MPPEQHKTLLRTHVALEGTSGCSSLLVDELRMGQRIGGASAVLLLGFLTLLAPLVVLIVSRQLEAAHLQGSAS